MTTAQSLPRTDTDVMPELEMALNAYSVHLGWFMQECLGKRTDLVQATFGGEDGNVAVVAGRGTARHLI
jgi:hypothetical protein